jgi:hypothetical protein
MQLNEMAAIFDEQDDEHMQFERIQSPRHPRPDIAAFLLLHELVPGQRDMVCAAEHDEIYLDVRADDLALVVTEEQIIELIRCGVRFDSSTDSLCMFV